MAKRIIQDILVKKSGPMEKKIVSLKFPSQRKKEIIKTKSSVGREKRMDDDFELEVNDKKPIGKNANSFLWFIAIICVIVLASVLSITFAKATITVQPTAFDIVVKDNLKIEKGVSDVKYEILEIEKNISEKVEPDSKEYVERKAVGTVVLYNEYSTTVQRFVTNTRLESTDGLIYKIRQSVDIPGYKMKDGQKIPGSISTEVVAEAIGDKYNMTVKDLKGDFKIAAYKGTTKYDKFYARLSTDISGGFAGEIKKISEEKFNTIQTTLREKLRNELIAEMKGKTMPDYIVPEGAYKISFANSTNELTKDNEIKEIGKIVAISFDTFDLAKLFSDGKEKNTENTSFAFTPNTDFKAITSSVISKSSDNISIAFSGAGKNICKFDSESFSNKISGVKKSLLASVIASEYSECIDSVQVSIYPQWNRKLPKNPVNIKVVIENK